MLPKRTEFCRPTRNPFTQRPQVTIARGTHTHTLTMVSSSPRTKRSNLRLFRKPIQRGWSAQDKVKSVVAVAAFLLTFLALNLSHDSLHYDSLSLQQAALLNELSTYSTPSLSMDSLSQQQQQQQQQQQLYMNPPNNLYVRGGDTLFLQSEKRIIVGGHRNGGVNGDIPQSTSGISGMSKDGVLSETLQSVKILDSPNKNDNKPNDQAPVATDGSTSEEESTKAENPHTWRIHYNHTELLEQQTYNGKYAVFFHIFFPENTTRKQEAALEQQFKLIKVSPWGEDTMYVTTIGKNRTVCPPRRGDKCQHIGHYDQGWEERTLTSILRYCRANPQDTVGYVHNKGSFNDNFGNARNRRMATRAVLSKACRSMPHTPYNVCALRFNLSPYWHLSTNFFAAKCEYVRKLVPPVHYSELRLELCKTLYAAHNVTQCKLDDTLENYEQINGFGRHSMERWVVSHPRFLPIQSHEGNLIRFSTGLEPFQEGLYEPASVRWTGLAGDMRQMIKFQLKQFDFIYGEYAPEGGTCQKLFSLVEPPLCRGHNHTFQSVAETTTQRLMEEFDGTVKETLGRYPWERKQN